MCTHKAGTVPRQVSNSFFIYLKLHFTVYSYSKHVAGTFVYLVVFCFLIPSNLGNVLTLALTNHVPTCSTPVNITQDNNNKGTQR